MTTKQVGNVFSNCFVFIVPQSTNTRNAFWNPTLQIKLFIIQLQWFGPNNYKDLRDVSSLQEPNGSPV